MISSTKSHRAPLPQDEPAPTEAPPKQDEPAPHPDPQVQLPPATKQLAGSIMRDSEQTFLH